MRFIVRLKINSLDPGCPVNVGVVTAHSVWYDSYEGHIVLEGMKDDDYFLPAPVEQYNRLMEEMVADLHSRGRDVFDFTDYGVFCPYADDDEDFSSDNA